MARLIREYPQSVLGFWLFLGPPAALSAAMLVHLGQWGLGAFPASSPALRLALGYGPFLWAGGLLLVLAWVGWSQAGVTWELAPTRLARIRGPDRYEIRLDRAYVSRSPSTVFPNAVLSDGQRQFTVLALFLPRFGEFVNLVEAGSRIRRAEQTL